MCSAGAPSQTHWGAYSGKRSGVFKGALGDGPSPLE